MNLGERLMRLTGCHTVHCKPVFGGGHKAGTEGGYTSVIGHGRTQHEAMSNALRLAADVAIAVAESKHAAEIGRIKQLATVEPEEDPRDTRIRELEREVAELQAKIRTAADTLGEL